MVIIILCVSVCACVRMCVDGVTSSKMGCCWIYIFTMCNISKALDVDASNGSTP